MIEQVQVDILGKQAEKNSGNISKTDIKYFTYYKKTFEEYTIWWASDLVSVSLYVKPDLDSLDKVIKLYSYRISLYDEIRLKKIYSSNSK